MGSELDSVYNDSGSSPYWGHCVVFLGKHFIFTVPLSTWMYKRVPAY